jgi:RHS repeat-associated protein
MKKTINMLLAFATISVNLHAVSTAPPAPLPDFMDKAQMAKWNADQASVRAASFPAPTESSNQFYTGKPYVADVDGYIYKYRTYNPEMSRWTSTDPSGFPDGVNNNIYAPVPTSGLDCLGLDTYSNTDTETVSLSANDFASAATGAINGLTQASGISSSTYSAILSSIQSHMTTFLSGINLSSTNVNLKCYADLDPTAGTWSNPSTVAGSGPSSSINFNIAAGAYNATASIGYAVTYNLPAPSINPVDEYECIVNGTVTPGLAITISYNVTLVVGGGASSTGPGVLGTDANYSVDISE